MLTTPAATLRSNNCSSERNNTLGTLSTEVDTAGIAEALFLQSNCL